MVFRFVLSAALPLGVVASIDLSANIKTMAENVDNISRSRRFKKIIGALREKEQHFTNNSSNGVR